VRLIDLVEVEGWGKMRDQNKRRVKKPIKGINVLREAAFASLIGVISLNKEILRA
jgi:hypothetical protein